MKTRLPVLIIVIAAALAGRLQAVCPQPQSDQFGPKVTSFLELMQVEETELEFQMRQNEISRREYTLSKNRIAVMRQTVMNAARETGEDRVPELHIVVASEVGQIVESGVGALKGVKAGSIVEGKWLYLGTVTRGEMFYVFERLLER